MKDFDVDTANVVWEPTSKLYCSCGKEATTLFLFRFFPKSDSEEIEAVAYFKPLCDEHSASEDVRG